MHNVTCPECGEQLPDNNLLPVPVSDNATGRPTRLNELMVENIAEMVREGSTFDVACESAGISSGTAGKWMTYPYEPYLSFRRKIEQARGIAESKRIRRIAQAGERGNWQADAWWLERMQPGRWGRKDRLEVTGSEGGPILIEQVEATVYQIALIARQFVPEEYWPAFREAVAQYIENTEIEREDEGLESNIVEGEVVS